VIEQAIAFFGRATVLRSDCLGLLFAVKALPSGAPAANLPAAYGIQTVLDLTLVSLFLVLNR